MSTWMHEHLADVILSEMEHRGWSVDDLVMNMGPHASEEDWGICKLSWEMFFAVRVPAVILGDRMAAQLEDAFDVPATFFTNFHESWRFHAKDAVVQ